MSANKNAVQGLEPDLDKELRGPHLQKSGRVAAPSSPLSALVEFFFAFEELRPAVRLH